MEGIFTHRTDCNWYYRQSFGSNVWYKKTGINKPQREEISIAYIFDKISFGNNLQIQENKNKPFEINFDEA